MLHDQETMVVLFQDGHKLEGCEGTAHFQGSEVAIESAEDTGVVAADIKDLVALYVEMTVQGVDQHIHRSNQNIECLGDDGDCRVQFNFHDKIRAALKI